MERSDQIDQLATALADAQGKVTDATKTKENPAFRSRYADLASVLDAVRSPLSAAGIAFIQSPTAADGRVYVTTTLVHKSGQWVSETMSAKPARDDAQSIGSVVTYLRRYGLMAMVGIAPDDDDGEAAVGRGSVTDAPKATQRRQEPAKAPQATPAPAPTPEPAQEPAAHHESWAKARAGFCAELARLGTEYTYDNVSAFCTAAGVPRPSARDNEGRSKLLGHLLTPAGKDRFLAYVHTGNLTPTQGK